MSSYDTFAGNSSSNLRTASLGIVLPIDFLAAIVPFDRTNVIVRYWNATTGNVVYDNNLGGSDDIDSANPQAIGGGSIQIQTPNGK